MLDRNALNATVLMRCFVAYCFGIAILAGLPAASEMENSLDESYGAFGELKSEGESVEFYCFNVTVGERPLDLFKGDPRYPNLGAQRSAGDERIWFVSAAATGANTGESWEDAFVRVEDALIQAQGGDEVWVARGKYVPLAVDPQTTVTNSHKNRAFLVGRGVKVYGGFVGGENSLEQRNPDPLSNETELSGDLTYDDDGYFDPMLPDDLSRLYRNSFQVVVLIDPDDETVLDGFTVAGGNGYYGAGLLIRGDDGHRPSNRPRLGNLRIIGNYAQYRGAGLDIEGGYTPVLNKVSFLQNEASFGGGLYSQDTNELVLDGLYFEGNKASGGGGAFICTAGDVLLKNSLFRGNRAVEGGGVATSGLLNVHSSRFEFNVVYRDGGAFYGRGNIHSSVFRGNSAGRYGGALFLSRTNRLANLLLTGNVAGLDGGALIAASIDMQDWSNLTLTGNRAERFGGGVIVDRFSESNRFTEQEIANSLLANNAPDNVYVTPETFGNIIWRNSLLEGSGGSGEAWDVGLGVDGGGNLDADPLFTEPLSPVEAPTTGGVYRVLPASPALNAGKNSLLPPDLLDLNNNGNTSEALPYDITGAPRIQNGTVDMGAFEGIYSWYYHSADRNTNGAINLSEILRVIQFFNSPGYHCDEGTEDGYAPGVDAEAQDCAVHSSDYNPQDWTIQLTELLRIIQFFNTGAYHACPQGEDGFCPGAGG